MRKIVLFLLAAAAAGILTYSALTPERSRGPKGSKPNAPRTVKLYWFIPDGLRADPSVFKIYEWAERGLLPNLRKMMESGSYGYSMPVFPGHTPTNFATILTGSLPRVHGIADGPMHIEGYPLRMVSESGFSSAAKKVPPIWYTLEQQGFSVTVLSVPGSTPPELDTGITVRGRWGGWGPDFSPVIVHSSRDRSLRALQGPGTRLFRFGTELTRFLGTENPVGWGMALPKSFSPAREVRLNNWGEILFAYLYDSTDDGRENYDRVLFSKDKRREFAHLSEGEWSGWLPATLKWQTKNDYNINTPKQMAWERELSSVSLDTQVKIRVIKLGKKDFFRIRFLFNNLNRYVSRPSFLAGELISSAGPMVDFVDSFPPQLVYLPEDKDVFLEEARMSLAWHRDVVGYLFGKTDSDVIIHDNYTPNQMLTSRWWMGFLDPKSHRYGRITQRERSAAWNEVLSMYKGVDDILGEAMKHADEDTYIVLSSDHGIVPLDKDVRLNNLFARNGWLTFAHNRSTGEFEIEWEKTRVVFLKMDGIYINPGGLGGNYRRASGEEYKRLRGEVMRALRELRDVGGESPVARIATWEEAETWGLPKERVGDLIVANKAGYGWVEDLSSDLEIFVESTETGYKQAVFPDSEEGMLTPFAILGPGIRKGHRIEKPIRHIDQYPTLMRLLKGDIPSFVEGKPIEEIMASRL